MMNDVLPHIAISHLAYADSFGPARPFVRFNPQAAIDKIDMMY